MKLSAIDRILPWLWAAVWFTLPVSMKANGISLVIFTLAAVLQAFIHKPVIRKEQAILAGLFIMLFAWHATGLIFDPERHAVLKSLERKLSLVVIPVAMILVTGSLKDMVKWALRGFFAGLAVTGMHMLAAALIKAISGSPVETFTYHEFTRPYTLGAIYYSCYVTVALYLLAFREQERSIEKYKLPFGIFLVALLLLCASKLFIVMGIPAIAWAVIRYSKGRPSPLRYILPVLVIAGVIGGAVPFFKRMAELKNTDLEIIGQEKYAYDTPWNGLTFRLVLWRLAAEILDDENAWMTGTGIGSRQQILDSYYVSYGIYTGNPELGDKGYLGYNFHNQYLETLVGTGIPGLLILLAIIVFGLTRGKGKLYLPLGVYAIIAFFFITESMLERQAGIVFFCLLWNLGAIIQASRE